MLFVYYVNFKRIYAIGTRFHPFKAPPSISGIFSKKEDTCNIAFQSVMAPRVSMGVIRPPLLSKHGLHISSKNGLKSNRQG